MMKEFQEQQEKMTEEMGGSTNPMDMISKLMSGGLEAPEIPKASTSHTSSAPNALGSSGLGAASTKRSKRQPVDVD